MPLLTYTAQAQLRVPYTQQFSHRITPLRSLCGILRQHNGKRAEMTTAIASAYFKTTTDPKAMAQNTVITLKAHGIIDEKGTLSEIGSQMVDAPTAKEAAEILTRNLLINLDGILIIDAMRRMNSAGTSCSLLKLTEELRVVGFDVSNNSSDLSGVLGWLREAGVLSGYTVNEERCYQVAGISHKSIEALNDLSEAQNLFLRAMLALGTSEWMPYNVIVQHAESLYAGEVTYNWKEIERTILQPLVSAGLLELQKAPKASTGSRGGKVANVKPTTKFEAEVAEPILASMYKAAGFREVRQIRSISFAQLIAEVKQKIDDDLRAKSLEILAIRICQLLDLEFYGWRETDEALVAGGEVDGFMHTARLIYSRWQIQCKASDRISYEAIAKEVGVAEITLANVILIVSTGTLTTSAKTYIDRIVGKSPLNIIVLDGKCLEVIGKNPAAITGMLRKQSEEAMRLKPKPDHLTHKAPTSNVPPDDENDENPEDSTSQTPIENNILIESLSDTGSLFQLSYSTPKGSMYHGDSYEVLQYLIRQGVRVKLLFMSPPFALLKKKAYGNEDQEQYVEWFMRFAPLFRQILEPGGSFVMDIGGSWLPGIPARSLYQYKLLLRLCESDFYLAQEFYHYNPARLPTPAEWVTIRRLRVKDAMNHVWWFVKEPFVDSDNRRVLREYSNSMKDLIKNGYEAKMRPSGHQISEKFNVDNGGAIPSNLLQLSNTESNSFYLQECKRNNVKPHPARFPIGLPEFFIRFLTQPGDIVLDPFSGSNVTGEAAESLGRRWLSVEIDAEYIKGSKYRFANPSSKQEKLPLASAEVAIEKPTQLWTTNYDLFMGQSGHPL